MLKPVLFEQLEPRLLLSASPGTSADPGAETIDGYDRTVNSLDITDFKAALADRQSWERQSGFSAAARGDFNGDGVFNSLDITGFKLALAEAATPAAASVQGPAVNTTSVPTQPQAETPPVLGDFSGDGVFNSLDITPLKVALADTESWELATGRDAAAIGDFNGDGTFNSLDLTGFKRVVAGVPMVVFSAEETLRADPTKHFAFPSLTRAANDDLLLVYRDGHGHSGFGGVYLQRSSDGGSTWNAAEVLYINPPETGINSLDPAIFVSADGVVHAFVCQKEVESGLVLPLLYATSTDHGQTFGTFEPFDPQGGRRTMWISSHPVITDDAIYLPTIGTRPGSTSGFGDYLWKSLDDGATWNLHATVSGASDSMTDEWSLVQTGEDSFYAVFRNSSRVYTFARTSIDGGATWSDLIDITDQVAVFQDPELTWLDDVHTVLMLAGRRRDTGSSPGEVYTYISWDGGDTWTDGTSICDYQVDGGYTSTITTGDGWALMVYYDDSTTKFRPDIHYREITLLQ